MGVEWNKLHAGPHWQEFLKENDRVRRMGSQRRGLRALPESTVNIPEKQGQYNMCLTSKTSSPGKNALPPQVTGQSFPDYGTHLAFLGQTGLQFPVRALLDQRYLALLKGKKGGWGNAETWLSGKMGKTGGCCPEDVVRQHEISCEPGMSGNPMVGKPKNVEIGHKGMISQVARAMRGFRDNKRKELQHFHRRLVAALIDNKWFWARKEPGLKGLTPNRGKKEVWS